MDTEKRFGNLSPEERQSISLKTVRAIQDFLQLFISPVIARRITSTMLIIAGVSSDKITSLTGLCERSIRDLKKQLVTGDIAPVFEVKSGRGRKSKVKDFESQIVEEIEKGNYQTQQQIADMVHEKFGIKVSIMSISRLLKKTKSAS